MTIPNSACKLFLDYFFGISYAIVPLISFLRSGDCSVNATNDRITRTAHDLAVGTRLIFSTTGTMPALTGGGNLSNSAEYFVESVVDVDTFTIAATLGGAAIDFADAGTGQLSYAQQPLKEDDPIAVLIKNEVTGNTSPDFSTRKTYTAAAAVEGANRGDGASIPTQQFTYSVISGQPQVQLQYLLFIGGGSTTVGDLTETAGRRDLFTFSQIETISPGGDPKLFNYSPTMQDANYIA